MLGQAAFTHCWIGILAFWSRVRRIKRISEQISELRRNPQSQESNICSRVETTSGTKRGIRQFSSQLLILAYPHEKSLGFRCTYVYHMLMHDTEHPSCSDAGITVKR